MKHQPIAKIVFGKRHILARLISRVDLGVNHMGFGQCIGQKAMDVGREALEAGFITKKAMDIDDEQCASVGGTS